MKRSFALAIIGAGIAFSQDIVEISPFWAAYDSVKLGNAINDLYEDLVLPDSTPRTDRKYPITWESSDTLFLGHDGRINGRFVGENKEVSLTASIKNVGTSQRIEKKVFKVSIHGYEPYSNYLFAYFPSNDNENIYYALSNDGYSFTAMNNGKRVVAADTVSIKKGLRDPHVLRAPDGWFYMVNTDMKSAEGWASNRGMVLMRSRDLINWEHSTVHFPDKYKGKNFANVTRVWAPETFWDDTYDNGDGTKGRPLVYFSLLTNDGTIPYDKVFFAYSNKDFTDLEGEPQHFFDRGKSTIDMDIVYNPVDKFYHAFYKNEGDGGICKVTASSLMPKSGAASGSQWSKPSKALQQTTEAVEGAGVFKLINQNSWVLMYDCYMNGHYQFTSSSDLENFKFVQDTKTSGAFTPRHGTILPVTAEETAKLMKAFPTPDFEPRVIDIPDSIGVCDGKKVVGPCSGTKIIPYVKVDEGGWNETLNLKVAKGATVQFGPHPWDGKLWSWEGPNGFKSTDRENTLKNVDGDFSGYYTVIYTNETGCKSTARIKMVVDDPDKPYKEPDSTVSIAKRYRDFSKSTRLNRNPVYFDLLGNRLKAKPRNGIFVVK
ncbi:MAG: glycoside hydrolase family 43 protein [Fibrobacter sp.]|uniref:glycoside hydrolase family 43 protein n=1 Tax=Fibrobacter sp. TaxID=35828 RepID=UPI002A91850F|nr:glycoside hydrolase family 43 protein [Fibrobacter sp.]MDY6264048.1 glycoside hydrolase family 43 protein [Fibrobacter sp.]